MSLFFSFVNFYKVSDVATCYKLFPNEFFQSINIHEKGFSIEIELISKFLNSIEAFLKYLLSTKVEAILKVRKSNLKMVFCI
jgi:hypothetical protein